MLWRSCKTVLACSALLMLAAHDPASAFTEQTIYRFCSRDRCADGFSPGGPLVMDPMGKLYGANYNGGASGAGTIFELIPRGHNRWRYRVIYDFCTTIGCSDGRGPVNGLIIDRNGNLYGENDSAIFELTPNPQQAKWAFHVLYDVRRSFGGYGPAGGLSYFGAALGQPYDGVSPLYGMTHDGGSVQKGAVFELAQRGESWQLSMLYNFCSKENCIDGAGPTGPLLVSAVGKIFGTTINGGNSACGCGTAYELDQGRNGRWLQTTLHSFCSKSDCVDGAYPLGGLAVDAAGSLIGVTSQGGAKNLGAIYNIVPNGRRSRETVLHNFCSEASCIDGEYPQLGVTPDASGDMIGTVSSGGAYGNGIVYRLSGSTFSTLYSFCPDSPQCADGEWPGPITLDAKGNIFGIAGGGILGSGIAFELSP